MLNKIRKPSAYRESRFKKFFAYIFFALICFILVLFMPVTSQLTGGAAVAYVGKQAVSQREFRLALESARPRYQDRLDKAQEKEWRRLTTKMERETLNQLINNYILSQAAEKAGLVISDAAVRDQIQALPYFQSKGRFVYSRYRNLLKRQNLSAGKFEERVRREILVQTWQDMFFAALRPAVSMEKSDSGFKADIRFAALPEEAGFEDEETLQNLLQEKSRHAEASRFLKKLNVQWKTIEGFSPSSQNAFPFDGSKALLQAVLSFLPETGFAPFLIRERGRRYAAEVLSFEKVKKKTPGEKISSAKSAPANRQALAALSKDGNFDFLLNYAKPLRLFESHLEAARRQIKIKINEQYFQ